MKKMKSLLVLLLAIAVISSLVACGGGKDDEESKEYIKESDIEAFFTSPNDFEGKYVKLVGKVFNMDKLEDTTYMQVWYDVANADKSYIVSINKDVEIKKDDIIVVDGKIEGEFSGKEAFGGNINSPYVKADKVERSSYIEAIAPAEKTREVNKSVKQKGITLTVQKVEFSELETRVYATMTNKSKYKVSVYTGSAKVIQNKKTYEVQYNTEIEYPQIDELKPGETKECIIAVQKLDPKAEMILQQPIFSEKITATMKDFKIKF